MAGIAVRKLVLYDKWPGFPDSNLGKPTDGFDSTGGGHDVSDAAYPIGTKIQIYTDFSTVRGSSILTYLHFYCMSGDNSVTDVSTGHPLFHQCCNSTCVSADGTANPFSCTNSAGIDTGYKCATTVGVVALPCGTCSHSTTNEVTTDGANSGRFGWFWTGGVCPVGDCTMYDTATYACISTGGNVAAGEPIYPQIDTSVLELDGATDLSANACGYSLGTDA